MQSGWQPAADVDTLVARARLTNQIRQFFIDRDVIEVHTPVLGRCTVTDPDIESIQVPGYGYLQTSPEYFLKRLLVAGMPSCYQLGSVFRHGELGRQHNAEFLMLEWYRLGYDHRQLMQEVADLVNTIMGPAPVQTISYAEVVGLDRPDDRRLLDLPRDQLDLAFAEGCAALQGRWFVVDYPVDQAVLARVVDGKAARFEMVLDGVEVANGYWELQGLEEHARRFGQDQRQRADRQLATIEPDEAFLAAIHHGLPDCAGVAVGVDRLMMLALGQSSLDGVMTFRI